MLAVQMSLAVYSARLGNSLFCDKSWKNPVGSNCQSSPKLEPMHYIFGSGLLYTNFFFFFIFGFLQSIPRMVWLDRNERQLVQWPVDEVESLRDRKVKLFNKVLVKGEPLQIKGLTAEQVSVPPIVLYLQKRSSV